VLKWGVGEVSMAIITECTGCGRALRVPDSALGMIVKCPACGLTFHARDPSLADRNVGPAPQPAPTAWPEPHRDEEDYQERPQRRAAPRRRPRRGRSSSLAIVVGVAGIVLLVSVGLIVTVALWPKRGGGDSTWQFFEPPGADCSVLMPGMPERKNVSDHGAMPMTIYGVERDRGTTLYAVGWGDMPAHEFPRVPVEERCVNGCRGMMSKLPGSTLVSQRKIFLDGQPGMEFEIRSSNAGNMVLCCCFANRGPVYRFYMLVAASPYMSPTSDEAIKLRESFKLTGPANPMRP
jgi:hypothetical protein